uniref:C-type lectin domain-containing protein n=1 Tax=Dicentrarchus labrax TaxID=13489 RepID=A0A8C4NWB0_DICLA
MEASLTSDKSLANVLGKHVLVQQRLTWDLAQQHCREHYTDLSSVSSWWDEERLKDAAGNIGQWVWVGLYLDGTQWKWSGGGNSKYVLWASNEPDGEGYQSVAAVCWQNCNWNGQNWVPGWYNIKSSVSLPFLCFNLILVEEKKTWEHALLHCSQEHTTLTSLVSETENLQALRKIQHNDITQRVWIGLRFLGDRWLWVDRDPLVYENWAEGGEEDYQCPIMKRCGKQVYLNLRTGLATTGVEDLFRPH